MNKKIVIGLVSSMLVLGAVSSVRLLNNVDLGAKAAQKTDGSFYYYVGDKNEWNINDDSKGIEVGSNSPTLFAFDKDEAFKFAYSSWSNQLNYTNLSGTAKSYFYGSGLDETNICCNVAGNYNVYITGTTIYIDFADENFYVAGLEDDWTVETAKTRSPITVDGAKKPFTLTAGEKFKLISNEGWAYELNWNNLSSSYYSCFSKDGNTTNIKINRGGNYLISVVTLSHDLKIQIEADNPSFGTVYVLDLNGDLLSANPRLHGFDGTIETDYPGYEMEKVAGTKNIYSGSYWDALTKLQFNNGTTYTVEYTASVVDGKCLALDWGYSNEHWTSNTWISLEAAKFIDSYMKFESNHQDDGSHTNECDARYAAAKAAYQAAAFESYRADVCKVNLVVARMQEWAMAHGETFIVTDGVGSFSSFAIPSFESKGSDNTALVTTIVALSTVAAAGAFFLLRKKNEE